MDRTEELFLKYYGKTATEEECLELGVLMRQNRFADFDDVLKTSAAAHPPEQQLIDPVKATQMVRKILSYQPPAAVAERLTKKVHLLHRSWIRYAAIVLLIAGTAAYFYTASLTRSGNPEVTKATTDIQPGGNKATLTLADGRMITLDSVSIGNLASQGNTSIIKPDAGSLAYNQGKNNGEVLYNTISTPKGGQYQVVLPDGSKVWLNAASSIRFPTSFIKERDIEITGEVYFEVKTNPKLPFYVAANGAEIQVLGTSFNVNGYSDEESTKTTLVEGQICVKADERVQMLDVGQQAEITKTGNLILRKKADMVQVMAWKNGYFHFKDADIYTVMRQLARWYDVQVIYAAAMPARKFEGELSRDLQLSQVLNILHQMGISYKLDKRTLLINP